MKLNAHKTEAMVMKRKLFTAHLVPIKTTIKRMDYNEVSKVIGVHKEASLDWNIYIEHVSKKCTGIIVMLRNPGFLPAPKQLKKSISKR